MLKRSVYVSGRGGLGNQIHSLHAAYCAAQQGHLRIKFLLPRKEYNPLRPREVFLDTFKTDHLSNCNVEIITPAGLSLLRWAGIKLRLIVLIKMKFLLNLSTTSKLQSIISGNQELHKSIHLGGHYENSNIPVEARLLGFPHKFVLQDPGTSYQALKLAIGTTTRRQIIGLHVRLGDFRYWQDGTFLLDASYYRERLDFVLKENPTSEVWIFSDEPKVAASFVEDMAPFRVISEDFDLTNAEELLLLAATDVIISSHGTFSWWSCFWKEDQRNIYYPDPSLCLSGWVDKNFIKH